MYEGWTFERWETPISDLQSIAMVSLVDDGELTITVEDVMGATRSRWAFRFARAPIYQNIPEEYRLELWRHVHERGKRYGWTVRVPNSPWLFQLKANEALMDVHDPSLQHFQIGSEDDIIDVLSAKAPDIIALGPARETDRKPGKSHVLFAHEFRDEVDALIESAKRRDNDIETTG